MKRDAEHAFAGILRVLGLKWTDRIVDRLSAGPERFVELERGLPGISAKTLALRLKELEQQRVIAKEETYEGAAANGYRLTDRGRSLREILEQVRRWGDGKPA